MCYHPTWNDKCKCYNHWLMKMHWHIENLKKENNLIDSIHMRVMTHFNNSSVHLSTGFLSIFNLRKTLEFNKVRALQGERGGSVVECRTPEREFRGSRPTAAVLCPWARHFTPRKYWLITQEAMAPSRHDWKIVDWDVKPQYNQPTKRALHALYMVQHNT